ncbi:MAG: hypothetical protein QMC65_07325 [Candidatus Poseidoniaceae archaeon]|jgi:hypothetical protein
MGSESIDVDDAERWFLFAPMVLLVFGWFQLNLVLLGYNTSMLSVLVFLPVSFLLVDRIAPKATSKSKSSRKVLLILVVTLGICELIRPATSYPVQYDAAYHILQASTYADILDIDAFSRIFRPPLLPILLSATLAFDESGSMSLMLMRFIVLLLGLQTYTLAKKLGASTTSATVFAVVAMTSPAVLDWGARYYHGVFAAMLATMVMNLLLSLDWKKCSSILMLIIGFSSGGVALARYSFSFLLGIVGFSGLMSKKIQPMVWFILGWSLAILPFMLNDWMQTGDLLASLRPQIDAPVDRALDPVAGVGWSAENFPILGYLEIRLGLLSDGIWWLCLGGIVLLLRRKKWKELAVLSAISLPHIMIYSLLLGYGEVRYMLLLVPLGCALAALFFEPMLLWMNQLIFTRPDTLERPATIGSNKAKEHSFRHYHTELGVKPALSVMVVLLVVFAPFISHLNDTHDYHSKTEDWVMMLRSISEEVPENASLVASSKDTQVMWLTKEYSREPPHEFDSLYSWMSSNHASHIITKNRGNPEPCARDVMLCIEAPWLVPIASRSGTNGWMVLWEFDETAEEHVSSNLSIEPFTKVEGQWHGHEEGTTDLLRNDFLLVRHYDDEVTLNPAFANATSIEIDIVVFRFDAWPSAAIDLESGSIEDISADERFYAASWNGTSFAHSGPFEENNSLPSSLSQSYTFSPSEYGNGAASGVHYIRLRAIYS